MPVSNLSLARSCTDRAVNINSDQRPSTAEIQFWLEWAGARLLSMPSRNLWPQAYRSFWPETEPDLYANLGQESLSSLRIRPPIPTGIEIDLTDEILAIIALVPHEMTRRVLQLRSLVHPVNGRYKYGWMKIATRINSDRRTLKRLHNNGLVTLTRVIPEDKVCRFSSFINPPSITID